MKTVRIDDENHALLVAYAAYLTLQKNRKVEFAEALHELLKSTKEFVVVGEDKPKKVNQK